MGKTFVCSLCRNGIIGGGLYIDEPVSYTHLDVYKRQPDLFCRRFTRQNHRCAAWAVFFFFHK